MTVHAIRIVADTTPGQDVASAVQSAHAGHTEALPEDATPFGEYPNDPSMNKPEHLRGVYRYPETEDLPTLLADIEGAIPAATPWFAIYYHVCDHDIPSDLRDGCTWESSPRRARGSVPTEVRP